MNTLVSDAVQLLNQLQGVVDQLRVATSEADQYHATLQPKLAEVAQLDTVIAAKTEHLREVSAALKDTTAAYDALRAKLL